MCTFLPMRFRNVFGCVCEVTIGQHRFLRAFSSMEEEEEEIQYVH